MCIYISYHVPLFGRWNDSKLQFGGVKDGCFPSHMHSCYGEPELIRTLRLKPPSHQAMYSICHVRSGVGKCPFLGILNITFKYLLEIISPILGWCSIGIFTNPWSPTQTKSVGLYTWTLKVDMGFSVNSKAVKNHRCLSCLVITCRKHLIIGIANLDPDTVMARNTSYKYL